MVFDTAAVFKGKCLNDACITGPVLINDLPNVLIKFREGALEFSADIEAMLSRVRMRAEDSRLHGFLWKDSGSKEIVTYRINRITFGDRCSPFVAIFATIKTAETSERVKKKP